MFGKLLLKEQFLLKNQENSRDIRIVPGRGWSGDLLDSRGGAFEKVEDALHGLRDRVHCTCRQAFHSSLKVNHYIEKFSKINNYQSSALLRFMDDVRRDCSEAAKQADAEALHALNKV